MAAIDFAQKPLLDSRYNKPEPYEVVMKKEKEKAMADTPWQIRHAFKGHCVTWMLLLFVLVAAFVAGILIVMPIVDRANDIASQAEDLMKIVAKQVQEQEKQLQTNQELQQQQQQLQQQQLQQLQQQQLQQ